jgi:hypothetical protein
MDGVNVLPDGSAFLVGSFPLPKDHWLYAPNCEQWDGERDTSADTPHPILDGGQREAVIAAIRYAVRGATRNGTVSDFDPDALVLNAAYALCGPCGNLVQVEAPNDQAQGREASRGAEGCAADKENHDG